MGLISNIVHYSNTAAKALTEYDNDLFPNIHALLTVKPGQAFPSLTN